MMEDFLCDLLSPSKEDILRRLQDNDITDMKTLGEIITSHVDFKELIPSMGLRLKIKSKYMSMTNVKFPSVKNQQEEPVIAGIVNADGSVLLDTDAVHLDVHSQITDSLHTNIVEPPQLLQDDKVVTESRNKESAESAETFNLQDTDLVTKKRKLNRGVDFDVKEILEKDATGRAVLNIYNNTRDLSTKCQSYVCDIIVTHALNNCITNLRNEDFDAIADNIVHVFPEECKETYYVPPVSKRDSSNQKSKVAKGKLVDKYWNKISFLREAKINVTSDVIPEAATCMSSEAHQENSKLWLIHNRAPWADVINHWNTSYTLRLVNCMNKKTLHDLLEEWPILLTENSYLLIEQDFCQKYKEQDQLLIRKWNDYFNAVLSLNRKYLSQSDELLLEVLKNGNLTQNSQNFIQISLLAALVPPKSNKISIKKQGRRTY
ncbi:uncharacterized protein LOC120357201 [Solenopsis invicta]|uniref:uncharacterized protein LOC120357201 n=1 Tax=Solenopsis invicta TaxID=13686 RepID=UPI00193D7F36|nr:uncharacterized protein LOC120357201 [Solenopsis invicta]